MPFTVALAVMFGIALLEGVTTLFGAALSSLLDSLLPQAPGIEVGLETEFDGVQLQSSSALSRLLGWLRFGQVPVLMLLVIFLTAFGLIGLSIQAFTHNTLGFLWPGSLASIPALLLALPAVRLLGGVLARILPRDETYAVPVDSLVGRVATITIGTARLGRPAEARVRDQHGTTHYLMVEPDTEDSTFPAGQQVLLVRRAGSLFKAIDNPNPSLVDR